MLTSLRSYLTAALVAAAAVVLAVSSGAPPSPGAGGPTDCPACTVQPGPGQYVGSLLIPPGSRPDPASLPAMAASCAGCVWTLEPACQRPGDTGDVVCPGALRWCPPPQLRLALLLLRPGDEVAARVGTLCLGPGEPLQPTQLLPGVRDRFVQLLPALHPSAQPSAFGVVNVPTVFATGQPGGIGRPVFGLAGHRIALSATATWQWRFGDGAQLVTARPGGPWPDVEVNHPYARDGSYVVGVTTTWQGQFWVDGAGPFPVDGAPVVQSAQLVVPVRAAVAQLVG